MAAINVQVSDALLCDSDFNTIVEVNKENDVCSLSLDGKKITFNIKTRRDLYEQLVGCNFSLIGNVDGQRRKYLTDLSLETYTYEGDGVFFVLKASSFFEVFD